MNAQHFARKADGGRSNTMAEMFARPMTDAELLQHYIERERIIHAGQRTPGHYRLRELGFIQEYSVSLRNLLIVATSAGRTAIDCLPAADIGTHPTLWGYTAPASSEMPAHHAP